MKPKKITNDTDNEYVEELVVDVLNRTKKSKFLSADDVVIDDYDLDRVYLDIDDHEYTIRTWNISEDEETGFIVIEWTLYITVDDYEEKLKYGITMLPIKDKKEEK